MTSKLTIGLLECDHVPDDLRSATGGDYSTMFRDWLAPSRTVSGTLRDTTVQLVAYDVVAGRFPDRVDEVDGWLCSGSRNSVYDDVDWIHTLRDTVAAICAAEVPYVGVCFGHQMLAHALGGRVARAETGWGAGVYRIDVVGEHRWLDPAVESLQLHFMHQDQVLDLPAGASVVGSADHCPNAMFAVGTSFGVQAHPEFTPAYTRALLEQRELRIGEETTASGLASLATPTDDAVVADWALNVWS